MFPRSYFGARYFGALYFPQSIGGNAIGNIEYPWSPGFEYAYPVGTGLPMVCPAPAAIMGSGTGGYPWTPGVIA